MVVSGRAVGESLRIGNSIIKIHLVNEHYVRLVIDAKVIIKHEYSQLLKFGFAQIRIRRAKDFYVWLHIDAPKAIRVENIDYCHSEL